MRYTETLTVPIVLDRDGRTPLHDQIADQLMAAIRAGSLAHGTRMPSTRTLAGLLGVSRGVAATGYDVLTARGFAQGRGGSGTYVVNQVRRRPPAQTPVRPVEGARQGGRPVAAAGVRATTAGAVDLTPGRGNPAIFPLAAWRSAWRQASCQVPPQEGPPAAGLPALRAAIAEHLLRTRGLVLDGHEVVVTGGAVAGLRLVLDVLAGGVGATGEDTASPRTGRGVGARAGSAAATAAGPGIGKANCGTECDNRGTEKANCGTEKANCGFGFACHGTESDADGPVVAVEELAPRPWRAAVAGAGRRVVEVGCDADGARVADLPAGCLAAVVTTDGHLGRGRTMPARRRAELGAWSAATGAVVLELACDAVFRPASSRLPRLLDGQGTTVLVGGLCEALTPALGLGYLVVPRALAGRVAQAVAARGEQPPYVTQRAVTQLLTDGTVTRLMHRRGLAQRHQLAIVEEGLAALRPAVTVTGHGAAGSVALVLPPGAHAPTVAATLRRHGLTVPAADATTLLVGHGHLPDAELRAALSTLVRVLAGALEQRVPQREEAEFGDLAA